MKKSLIACLILVFSFSLCAQESKQEMKPMKYENVSWQLISMYKYKPEKMDQVKKIIKTFVQAAEKENIPTMYWTKVGEYSLIMIWDLKKGPSELEWIWTESDINWYNKLIEIKGSEEAVKKLMYEHASSLLENTSYLTYKKNHY